ncbi:MAG: hypothetical protein AAGG01_23150, partial [Planctomycetota bacterium]
EPVVLRFDLAPRFSIPLQLSFNGAPAAGMRVQLRAGDEGSFGPVAILDEKGECVYEAPFDGACRVFLGVGERSLPHPEVVHVVPGAELARREYEATDLEIELPADLPREDVMYGTLTGVLESAGAEVEVKLNRGRLVETTEGSRVVRFQTVPLGLKNAQLVIASGPTEYRLRAALDQPVEIDAEAGVGRL